VKRVVVRCGRERHEFDLPEAEVVVGSGVGADWCLTSPGLSRSHAAVIHENDVLRIRDLGSKNGIWFRGERREEVELRSGQSIRLGAAEMILQEDDSSEALLALAIESGPQESAVPVSSTASAIGDDSASGPERALAHLRAVAAGRRAAAGETSRRLLGARSLVELRREPSGDVIVVAIAGEPIEAELLERISSSDRLVTRLEPVGEHRALWASAPHSHGLRLAALFDSTLDVLADWQESLFAALAGLIAIPVRFEDPRPEGEEETGSDLVFPPEMIVGRSAAFAALLEELRAAVRSGANVLLLGETGTGKELLAHTIHRSGQRCEGPFIDVNCTAIPESIFESELLGIAKGVATDVSERRGRILQANGGTLFLDEVGDIPRPLQPKLLRVIQEREVLALGAERARKVDITFVAATNRSLAELIGGALRSDLFYRLGGMVIQVPPLRERSEDIPALVLELTRRYSHAQHRRIGGVSARALSMLLSYAWPGNVRELENVLQIAVAECPIGGHLRAALIEKRIVTFPAESGAPPPPWSADASREETTVDSPEFDARSSTLREVGAAAERAAIEGALARVKGRIRHAADLLGLSERGLRKAMRRLGIQPRG
jgi:DNA-binding NtrC family response regulator